MKNSCNVASLVLLLALFANAQEILQRLPNDSSLIIATDSSLAAAQKTSLPVVYAIVQEKNVEKEMPKNNEDYQKNLRMAAYLHPLPLFYGAAFNLFMFSSTLEMPLSLSNSVIVQPSVWLGSSDGTLLDVEYEKLRRIGIGIGMRRYVRDRGQGFYLSAVASVYYLSVKSLSAYSEDNEYEDDYYYRYYYPEKTTWKNVKGVLGDLIFYIGSAHKWQNIGFFYEGGLGFGYDGTHTYQLGYVNRLAANFNLGVGIPF
jgi:hypothetical protein